MKRYSTIMSVLLALALPVATICADAATVPEKADAKADSQAKAEAGEKAIKDSMSKSKHMGMMGSGAATANAANAANTANTSPSGKVVQTMNGGGYTYANLEKDGKNTWVAFPSTETRVGDALSFSGCIEMQKFQSKALNRTFDSIMFCNAPLVKGAGAKQDAKKSPGSTGAASTAEKIKVEKATGPNAYTIAEIFAKRGSLNGKRVVVRGQVVKVSSGIMNLNWLHLQDGTGSDKHKTHDLVVTTKEMADVGQVVTVSGTLVKDKDFGAGYKYSAIIEKGSLKK